MSMIDPMLRHPLAQALGWALLQFLWQGALTALALSALRRSAADIRYVVSAISLALMLTMPVVTAVQAWRSIDAAAPASGLTRSPVTPVMPSRVSEQGKPRTATNGERPSTLISGASTATIVASSSAAWVPLVAFFWLCGVAVLSLRLASGWLWVQRMKRSRTIAPAECWRQMAATLSRRLHIKRTVRVLESAAISVPIVIGWLRPVVLLPASVLAGLPAVQVEAILAHELAHVRRHDYFVNLLQTLVETLLFYHPAVWWVSRRIRVERENCCDDLAVSLCGDPYTYARALADLEELRGLSGPLVLAATGGSLVARVRRVLGAPSHAGRAPGWAAGVASVALIALAAVASASTGLVQSAGGPPVDAGRALPAGQPPAILPHTAPVADALPPANRVALGVVRAIEPASSHSPAASLQALVAVALPTPAMSLDEMAVPAPVPAAPAAAAPTPEPAQSTAPRPRSRVTMSWSNGSEKMEITYTGEIEFTDDDADVKRLSPGGELKMSDGRWFSAHSVELRADASGTISRRYWEGTSERPYDPAGRRWLAQSLPALIRRTGIGAATRVARFLKAGGPAAVLAEITLIDSDWAKHVYFTELLKTGRLDSEARVRLIAQAGRDIRSDFELASLLIEAANQFLAADSGRSSAVLQAYFQAAKSIDSDYELRRVLSAALDRGPVSGTLLAAALEASTTIESDFEEASLLEQVAKLQPLDATNRQLFFTALATVQADFEHHRVLAALASRGDLTPEIVTAMLESSTAIGSDFEQAGLLTQIAAERPLDGQLSAPFFRAVAGVASAFERAGVLQAVVNRPNVSQEVLVGALRSLADLKAGYEVSQVLQTIAARHQLTGATRDSYIDVASRLGSFEQGRALSALVASDRRQ